MSGEKLQTIARLSEEDLLTLTNELIDNRIITFEQIPEELVSMVFLVVSLGGISELSPEALQEVGTIYEHYEEAGPRSVNGYPVFFSLHIVHKDDWKIVVDRYRKARAAIDAVLKG